MAAPAAAVTNWGGDLVSWPRVVVHVESVEEIQTVLRDKDRYPSPVRAVGSNHSTTRCGIADNGTLIVVRKMDRILNIDRDKMTVTAQAGALYIDVVKELEKNGLQFYVNVELGNLTMGSGATGGTKDASMPGELGQICSYATSIKMVLPNGELKEVNESEPELLQVTRSSYGLFGIVYEVTFRVQALRAMHVYHETFNLDDFCRVLPSLWDREESMMMYIDPFLDRITVEFREYGDGPPPKGAGRRRWRMRNFIWKQFAPSFCYFVRNYVGSRRIKGLLYNTQNRIIHRLLRKVVNQEDSYPGDQMIRYPERGGRSAYWFSIWAFPEERYTELLREYFDFIKSYYKETGFRCDLVNVGYRISSDQGSLFSYSYHGNVMTIDPVATGGPGWETFLVNYNEWCSERGGVPLFNQSKSIAKHQATKAFGDRLDKFEEHRKQFDPDDRLLNVYFAEFLK